MSENITGTRPQNLIIESRERLFISGVTDIESFDEEQLLVKTVLGDMIIAGKRFNVKKLNVDSGDLELVGYVISITYREKQQREKGGILKRMFK